ncbi:hypothetical protein GCM10010393_28880 [Streptomyces gobitricini]|uniref:Uncharacterized protein n=1 Tax=Streptomyces gobitricini TaxID=68211 RepID=A0ABN3M3A4_9ACTN
MSDHTALALRARALSPGGLLRRESAAANPASRQPPPSAARIARGRAAEGRFTGPAGALPCLLERDEPTRSSERLVALLVAVG